MDFEETVYISWNEFDEVMKFEQYECRLGLSALFG